MEKKRFVINKKKSLAFLEGETKFGNCAASIQYYYMFNKCSFDF